MNNQYYAKTFAIGRLNLLVKISRDPFDLWKTRVATSIRHSEVIDASMFSLTKRSIKIDHPKWPIDEIRYCVVLWAVRVELWAKSI